MQAEASYLEEDDHEGVHREYRSEAERRDKGTGRDDHHYQFQ